MDSLGFLDPVELPLLEKLGKDLPSQKSLNGNLSLKARRWGFDKPKSDSLALYQSTFRF